MLARPLGLDAGITRPFSDGDVMDSRDKIALLTTVGAGSITAAMISSSILSRTGPVGGFTDTVDTAQNIVNAFSGNTNSVISGVTFGNLFVPANVPQQGATWRWLYINGVAQALTLSSYD
jgi:hypothetical protein